MMSSRVLHGFLTASNSMVTLTRNSTGTAVMIKQQGSGNILEVKDGGSAVLTVADGGNVTLTNNLTVSGTMAALDMAGQIDLNNNNIIAGGTAAFTTVTAALSGNSSTATLLQSTRTINGVGFNGGSNITVTADANTLSNTTLKSTVVASSLTSVGTLTSLNMGGDIDLNTNNIIAGGTAAFSSLTTVTSIIRSSTTASIIISGGSTSILGANIKLFAQTAGSSRANDIEFRSATSVRMDWDDSALEFTVFGQMIMDDGGLPTDVAGVFVSASDPIAEDYVDGTIWCVVV